VTAVVFGTSDIPGSKDLQDRCVADGVRHGRSDSPTLSQPESDWGCPR
jgi:hypothetical protein